MIQRRHTARAALLLSGLLVAAPAASAPATGSPSDGCQVRVPGTHRAVVDLRVADIALERVAAVLEAEATVRERTLEKALRVVEAQAPRIQARLAARGDEIGRELSRRLARIGDLPDRWDVDWDVDLETIELHRRSPRHDLSGGLAALVAAAKVPARALGAAQRVVSAVVGAVPTVFNALL